MLNLPSLKRRQLLLVVCCGATVRITWSAHSAAQPAVSYACRPEVRGLRCAPPAPAMDVRQAAHATNPRQPSSHGARQATKEGANESAGALFLCNLQRQLGVRAAASLGGKSASATPSTTTRVLPCSTQRVSNTALRPTTRVAVTVACSCAPTSAVPRNARLCVRYSAPGCRARARASAPSVHTKTRRAPCASR